MRCRSPRPVCNVVCPSPDCVVQKKVAPGLLSSSPSNQKALYRSLRRIVEDADVLLEVLDARDPLVRVPRCYWVLVDATRLVACRDGCGLRGDRGGGDGVGVGW
jgi:hypothetical protein